MFAYIMAWAIPILVALVVGLVVGSAIGYSTDSVWASLLVGLVVFGVVLGVWAGFSAYTTIQPGYVGVVTRFGEIQENVFLPGLNWKTPFVERVQLVPTKYHTYMTTTSDGVTILFKSEDESNLWLDKAVSTQTKDGQGLMLTFSITFYVRPDQAIFIVEKYGNVEEAMKALLVPKVRAVSRTDARDYSAPDYFSTETIKLLQHQIFEELQPQLEEFGITAVSLEIRDTILDVDYIQSIENQRIAEVNIQTAEFEAEQAEYQAQKDVTLEKGRAQQAVIQAQAQAEIAVIKANAEAEALLITANAEAEAFRVVGLALHDYPENLTLEFIHNMDAVEWGILPQDVLPLLQIAQ